MISLIAGDDAFSREDSSPTGFDKAFGQWMAKLF